MFSNKPFQNNRVNRLNNSNPKRSTTPQHSQGQIAHRSAQSQSKPHPQSQISPPSIELPSITEQGLQFEKPYYLGKGNNHELIKRIISRRKGWREVNGTQFTYFRWNQNSYAYKFHLMGKQCYCYNHFQYQRELSNKQRLVKNLINFCQSNKMNVYSFVPVSFILDLNTGQEDLALHAFIKFFNRNYPDQSNTRRHQSIILPRSKYIPYLTAQQLNKRSQGNFYCKPFCPKTFFDEQTNSYLWILKPTFLNRGRGVVLFRELQELEKLIWKYYEGEGLEDYGDKYAHHDEKNYSSNKMESSMNQEAAIQQYQSQIKSQFGQTFHKKMEQSEAEQQNKKLNEKKQTSLQTEPSQNKKQPSIKKIELEKRQSNQSQKQVSKTAVEEQTNINSSNTVQNTQSMNKRQAQLPRCLSFIIQKYIEKPMLIQGKKFDIRVWVLLTQTLEFYVFEEAYLRFSSQPYSTKDSHLNPFVHLTNNSVQKYCNEFDNQSGNQWPLTAVQRYIEPQSKANNIYKSIVSKIKQIICLTIFSVRRKINVNSRKECFQLFGYDFMIDADYKVWLIEVNTNPAIQEASPLLKMLLPRMVDDMFKLTIDKIFNCKMKEGNQELPVTGYQNDHNMWEYLGDLREGGNLKNDKRLTFARR